MGVVCENGLVRVWKLHEPSVFINTNCSDVLTTGNLANFHITVDGVVFLMLGNGCSYSYSKQLESWLVVNSLDPIVRIGVSSFVQSQSKNMRQYPLNTVQSLQNNQFGVGRGFKDRYIRVFNHWIYLTYFVCQRSNTDWEKAAKLSFIENQINIAQSINSAVELEHWYGILGLHLAEHGTEAKVRMLLDKLVGVPNGLNSAHLTNQVDDKYLVSANIICVLYLLKYFIPGNSKATTATKIAIHHSNCTTVATNLHWVFRAAGQLVSTYDLLSSLAKLNNKK